MLTFENVSKSYWTGTQHKVILANASFTVSPGMRLGVLARNGTGKTTVINMMAGLEKPDNGKIHRSCSVSFPLGFMGGLVTKHTATENIRYIATLYSLEPDYVEAFCRWMCDIGEYFDMPIGTYSAGMRSRLALSLMLAMNFDLYLVDEGMPSTTDTAFNKRAGLVMQERFAQSGLVIVSHQAEILQQFCSSAAVLRDGKMYFFDTLEQAKELYDYAS
ncbi:ABC transporter ATP-binding protein [Roseinatronobacter alkalisoli]|uniref:ATP-binding cassette domain-containing protein n=1 Tax=Roseinatronobacter alkalisoli TaxID=3028235 RepID=A0ABT5T465_9RHOB|nr:ATP-binding cassette domain-containing protein [Roseinatronobacter sp. HJB301]MDD7969911.1 ATP-binding cassette domain-containing protein [Roseinatronobacter sp. HJB301]